MLQNAAPPEIRMAREDAIHSLSLAPSEILTVFGHHQEPIRLIKHVPAAWAESQKNDHQRKVALWSNPKDKLRPMVLSTR